MLRRCGGCVAALFLLQESGIIQSARAINEAKIVIVLWDWAKARQLAGPTRDSLSNPGFLPEAGPGPQEKSGHHLRVRFYPRKNPVAGPAGNARECIFQ